jgi:hypothetical protein
MTRRRRTLLLAALLVASACAAVAAHAHLRDRRAGASQARQSLDQSKRQLDELQRWRSGAGGGPGATAAGPDVSQLARVLRDAATEAGAADRLASVEPGQPQRLGGDYAQLPVFLRLEGLTLKQLTLFLHRLASLDPASRAQGIELSAAAGARGQGETWDADVTISYLTFAPGEQP